MLWRLPIPDETREAVRTESKIADVLQHNWVRWGSALFAAAFLEEFVDDTPVGAPRHRRTGVERPAGRGATCRPGATGYGDPHPGGVRRGAGRSRRARTDPTTASGPSDRGLTRLAGLASRSSVELRLWRSFCAGCTPASGTGCRPARRRTTARRCGWRTRAPTAPTGTRRRVHSPSWATSSSVTSVIVVRGSTKPSTPRRVRMNSSRWRWSASSDPRTMAPWSRRLGHVGGTDPADPCATSVLHGRSRHT